MADKKDPETTVDVVDLETGELTELQIETLAGDLRDAMLMRIRDIKRPWSMLTEEEQYDIANGLELASRELVRGAVRLLTAWEWPRVIVRMDDVKIIGGDKSRIEAKIVAANIGEYRDVLGEHAGQMVMVLAVDSENFMAARAPVAVDPDQPDLPGTDEREAA